MEEDKRLKQLLFRSQHRGFNEMDQLLTAFAYAQLAKLSPAELDAYGQLLDLPDWDAFAWITGQQEPPANLKHIVDKIKSYIDQAGLRG